MKINLKGMAKQITKPAPIVQDNRDISHILIVDDEEPNLAMLTQRLAPYYRITALTSGAEALRLIDESESDLNFSVVISDQMMPEMSGVEFLTELKKRQVLANRILLTGFSALETVVAAVNDAAIFRYVTKPVNFQQLLNVIKEADDHYAMKRENGRLISLVKELLEKTIRYEKQFPELQIHNPETVNYGAPRRRDLVILFADIRGFTKTMRQSEAEEVFAVLARIFSPLHEIIYASGGVVDKLLGDGFMAVFGLSGGTHIQNAVNATKNMAHKASEILSHLPPPFHELRLSFGLAAGSLLVGMMGSTRRSEYSVLGDTANFAARLQEATKLALIEKVGRDVLGDFGRVMVLCSEEIQAVAPEFRLVQLPPNLGVRDFPDVRRLGVYAPAS